VAGEHRQGAEGQDGGDPSGLAGRAWDGEGGAGGEETGGRDRAGVAH
jgi:hypothetical protein